MKNKYKFISILLIVFFLSLSLVSASDFDNETMSSDDTEIISAEPDYKSITELQQTINDAHDGDIILLNNSYINDVYSRQYIVNINKPLTLDGNGNTIDGNEMSRIFYIGADNVTLKNLVIVNGKYTVGGAISWNGNDGTIDNCVFEDNTATSSAGGAIYWKGNNGKIIDSYFTNNNAGTSGGVALIEGNDFLIEGNDFISNNGALGGAIRLGGNLHTISNNNFISNIAASSGGAIRIEGNYSTITNNCFDKNNAKGSLGGAMLVLGNDTYIAGNNFTDNIAKRDGGAINIHGALIGEEGISVPGKNNIIENNIFTNNSAIYGGAVGYNSVLGKINNNEFTKNHASELGGAIRGDGANITGNIFTDNDADMSGGAIYTVTDRLIIDGNTFIGDKSNGISASSGGNGGTLTVKGDENVVSNNDFINSTAQRYAGAVFAEGNKLEIINNNFKNCVATNNGGALYLTGNSATVKGNEFKDGESKLYGGAIYISSENAIISDNKFTANKAGKSGGAISSDKKSTIENNEFTDNFAASQGGALSSYGDNTVLNNNVFRKNNATGNGGAANIQGANLIITNNGFIENNAENPRLGGAIWFAGNNTEISSNKFNGNTARTGTAINAETSKTKVEKNTFYNSLESDRTLIRLVGDDNSIKDNIYTAFDSTTTLTMSDVTTTYGDSAKLTATLKDSKNAALANKKITITINDKDYSSTSDNKGQISVDLSNVDANTYTATASFDGDADYNPATATATVKINKAATTTTLTGAQNVTAGIPVTLLAEVNATEGIVTFEVSGQETTSNLTDGKATLELTDLTKGTYTVTTTYQDPNGNYITSKASTSFEVTTTATALTADDLTLYYGGTRNLTITLTDSSSKALAKKEIKFIFDVETIIQTTDGKGQINMPLSGYALGSYVIYISFAGDDEYEPSNTTATVTVKSTIEAEDLIADYNNATFNARFVDVNGVPLAKGEYILFTIGDDAYRTPVGENGIATLTIDRNHGEYTITSVNTVTQETEENNITINQIATETTLSGINDIEVGNNITAVATVNTTEGIVIFNVNGQETVVNLTDGEATLELNDLEEGPYTVTATYIDANENYLTSSANASFEVTKKIAVLTANNVTIYYRTYGYLTVTLTNSSSKPLVGREINIASGRIKFSNFTDDNGQITMPIFGLDVGSYEMYVTYAGDDEYMAANATVTVTTKSTIEAENLIANYNNATFTAKFVDAQGNPLLKGTNVTFIIDNDQYPASVDDNGVAELTIDKDHGEYEITAINPVSEEMTSYNITINQVATETILSGIKDSYVGDNMTIVASVNTTEGIVILKVDEYKATFNLTEGPASLDLFFLNEGTYTVTATYKDANDNYLTSSANATFKVSKKATVLTADNVTVYFASENNYTITLTDSESKGIARKEIIIFDESGNITNITNENGQIILPINSYTLGVFEVNMIFEGDEEYEAANTAATIMIKTTIESDNLTADYNNATFTARFLDTEGNPLAKGENITFHIEDDEYTVNVGEDGIATLTIDKNHGIYTITSANDISTEYAKNTITINQVATETTLDEITDLNAGDNLTITASVNATEGAITFKVNDDEVTVNLTDGKASLDLVKLPEGSYSVTATYNDTKDNYLTSSDSASFKVTKKDNTITVETNNITEDEDAVFNVTATAPNGKVTLTINGKSYTENLTDGKATFTVSNLTSGDYPYKVAFENDFYYASNSTEGIINVKMDNLVISAPDLTKYYHGPERFIVTVTDKEGNPLENITVQIVLNGVAYNRTTNASGIAGMNIGLGSGNYTAEVIYAGDHEHKSVNETANITVLPTVSGDDVTKIQKGPEPYYATFLDSAGNYLPDGTTVQFNINGVLYDRKVSGNLGVARLNLNLEASTYVITAMNPVTGENAANNITIKPRLVNNSDVTKFYRNGTQYYVTVLGDDGKPLTSGEVTFNINGVFYKRNINASGVARLNLNLEPGKYIITAEYNGCRVSNNITVLPVLSAKDIDMKYKDGTKFKATLVNGTGAPYPGKTVTFNINGVFYDRVTDKDGIAALNINLMPGKYIITSSYNGANIANTVTIKP